MSDELAPTTAERLDVIERRLQILEDSRPAAVTADTAPVPADGHESAPVAASPAPASSPADRPPDAEAGLLARAMAHFHRDHVDDVASDPTTAADGPAAVDPSVSAPSDDAGAAAVDDAGTVSHADELDQPAEVQ